MVVGQQHHGDVAGRLGDRVEVAGVERARVDDDRPATRRARASTQVLVPSRVISAALGASTHARPLAERPAGPGRS